MGVDVSFHTLLGVKIEFNDPLYEIYDERYNDPHIPNIIADGMSAEYMYLGVQYFDSGSHRHGFEGGDSFVEIDPKVFAEDELKYKENFIKVFPEFKHLVDVPFKLYTFIHYS